MTFGGILILLLIAAVSGSIAQALVGFTRGGCLVSIAVGFIGAIVGWWIATSLNLPLLFQINIQGQNFPVIWSIIGGALFVAVLNLISGRRH
ncbi:MAG: GlsB/YeaQ/YmgE family stress response membrane protein [Brevefilum sp.]